MINLPKRLFCAITLLILFPLYAQTVSPDIKKNIDSAFTEKTFEAISQKLALATKRAATQVDKQYALSVYASFLERAGNLAEAAETYRAAALVDPSSRDDGLFLDAARCALASNDIETASTMVRSVLLTAFNDTVLLRARVYSAWIQSASGDQKNALALLRTYAGNAQFEPYLPAILFTLWWGGGDTSAEKTLQKRYPRSAEAAAARGEVRLAPSPFWYLMNRDGIAPFVIEPVASSTQEDSPVLKTEPSASIPPLAPPATKTTGNWQQTGFFQSQENAESLAARLRTLGFFPIIRKDTRPSGTVYFVVLIPDDGTTAARLKDAGFESYLVTD